MTAEYGRSANSQDQLFLGHPQSEAGDPTRATAASTILHRDPSGCHGDLWQEQPRLHRCCLHDKVRLSLARVGGAFVAGRKSDAGPRLHVAHAHRPTVKMV
ncbi:hypothetical protein GCM10020218_096960 [Dactylosporangium vinaceum]